MGKIIAIDGPSGAGKTTVARGLADALSFSYLDTGALYRAVALALRRESIKPEDRVERFQDVLQKTTVVYRNGRVFVNGEDVSDVIRSQEMDRDSSVFSSKKIVRDFLFDVQRNAGMQQDLVVEGRDTTTVVFPHAEKKIFLDATLEERARRRFLQYQEKGIKTSMEEARKGIIERDERDAKRDIAPLSIASDALTVDTSGLSVEHVLEKILQYIRS